MTEHQRRFHGEADRLRSPDRISLLEVDRVVALSTERLAPSRLADIGTGSGVFAHAFAEHGLTVVGIDVNAGLLRLTREIAPGVHFQEAPAEAIPYGDRIFDIAFLGHVLPEADDPVQTLKEAGRISSMRVVVLEWPYMEEEQGPPLDHRLPPERIVKMGKQAGMGRVEGVRLTHMDLYRMSPEANRT
jgi:hypothetical protein